MTHQKGTERARKTREKRKSERIANRKKRRSILLSNREKTRKRNLERKKNIGKVSPIDRQELADARAKRAGAETELLEDVKGMDIGKFRKRKLVEEQRLTPEEQERKFVDIAKGKIIAKETAQAEITAEKLAKSEASGIEERLSKEEEESKKVKKIEQRGQDKLSEDILKTETELAEIRGREGVLNNIAVWRLETKLENQKERWEKTNRGEPIIAAGQFPIGLNVLGLLSAGKSFEAFTKTLKNKELAQNLMKKFLEQQNIIKTGIKAKKVTPQIVGGTRFNPASNPKSQMQLGNIIKKAGWGVAATLLITKMIEHVAWGKHVKAEAIEYLPYQMSKALESGDLESYETLRTLFKEIENPTGWANLLEEFPFTTVVRASINKIRTASATIDMLDKAAGFGSNE